MKISLVKKINNMNIQEAYNKGLDDAENRIHKSYSDALVSIDSGKLANPKMEQLRLDIMARNKPTTDAQDSFGSVRDTIENIIMGKEVELNDDNLLVVFKELMDHFSLIAQKKNNVGKAFAKIIKEKRDRLTSQ